jgi:hypothetical protein
MSLSKLAAEAPNANVDEDKTFEAMPSSGGKFDVAAFIERHGLDADEPNAYAGGQRWVFNTSPLCDCKGGQVLIQWPSGAITYKCSHDTCARKYGNNNHWKFLREKYEPGCYTLDDDPDECPNEPLTVLSGPSTQDLLHDGFIQQFAQWHAQRTHYPDLRLGAVAGWIAMSMLMARRVRLADDTRPNISIVTGAPSGGGKTNAVKSIKELLQRLGMQPNVMENVTGASAIEDELWLWDSLLVVFEEAHNLIKTMNSAKDTNLSTIARALKMHYSDSATWTAMRKKAAEKPTKQIPNAGNLPRNKPRVLIQPHLTLWLTAPSKHLWNAFNEESLSDGLVSRLTQIETPLTAEINKAPTSDSVLFAELLRLGQGWINIVAGSQLSEVSLLGPDGEVHREFIDFIQPHVITRENSAELLAVEAKQEFRQMQCDAEAAGDPIVGACWSRAYEMSCKIELIFVGSEFDPEIHEIETYVIPARITQKAIKLVRCIIEQKIQLISGRVGDERHDVLLDKVRRKLADKKCMKIRDAYSHLHIKAEDFKILIESLLMSEEVGTDAGFGLNGRIKDTRGKYVWLKGYRPKLEAKSK